MGENCIFGECDVCNEWHPMPDDIALIHMDLRERGISPPHEHEWEDWCDGMASCKCGMTLDQLERLEDS